MDTQEESKSNGPEIDQHDTPRRRHRQKENALRPELRLIDVSSSDELAVDQLELSRFESLTSRDYHLAVLPAIQGAPSSKNAAKIEDKTWLRFADPNRLFSSGASIFSSTASSDRETADRSQDSVTASSQTPIGSRNRLKPEAMSELLSDKLRIFVHSPYDCVIATKRDQRDHLNWLIEVKKYEEAWTLLQDQPKMFESKVESEVLIDDDDVFVTKTRSAQPSDETESVQASSAGESLYSALQKEKQRIGELWIEQEIIQHQWDRAGETCRKVLTMPSRWEHWISVFADAQKLDEIGAHVPSPDSTLAPGPTVYDTLLVHWVHTDRERFRRALEEWSAQYFTPVETISAIQDVLDDGEVRENSVEGGVRGRDWKILLQAFTELYQASGEPREALRYAMVLKDYRKTMDLIGEYHLLNAVANDIPGLIILSIEKVDIQSLSLESLRGKTIPVMHLLVKEASHGTVSAGTVVSQLQNTKNDRLLYLYLEALWEGQGVGETAIEQEMSDSRQVVNQFADLAVQSFATFNETLLMDFLQASQAYSLEKAIRVCEQKHFVSELVYLLSRTGQMKRALSLIIDELDDVGRAIAFAKSQNDAELWQDFTIYSMTKPRFIKGLLREAGSGINPVSLVRQIPEGLEIEGLKDDITHLLRELEVQASISRGVRKVLDGEVAAHMGVLHKKQRQGTRFGKPPERKVKEGEGQDEAQEDQQRKARSLTVAVPMLCGGCGERLGESRRSPIIGFPCGHMFHASCLTGTRGKEGQLNGGTGHAEDGEDADDLDEGSPTDMSVGRKMAELRRLRGRVTICPLEADHG